MKKIILLLIVFVAGCDEGFYAPVYYPNSHHTRMPEHYFFPPYAYYPDGTLDYSEVMRQQEIDRMLEERFYDQNRFVPYDDYSAQDFLQNYEPMFHVYP